MEKLWNQFSWRSFGTSSHGEALEPVLMEKLWNQFSWRSSGPVLHVPLKVLPSTMKKLYCLPWCDCHFNQMHHPVSTCHCSCFSQTTPASARPHPASARPHPASARPHPASARPHQLQPDHTLLQPDHTSFSQTTPCFNQTAC